MRVQAVKDGYYGNRRYRKGQVFNLVERKDRRTMLDEKTKKIIPKSKTGIMTVDEQFSDYKFGGWMRKVNRGVKDAPVYNPADGRIANLNAGMEDDLDQELNEEINDVPAQAATEVQDPNQEVI